MKDIVKNYRLQNNLSIREMAKCLGMSHATYYRIESGKEYTSTHLITLIRYLPLQNKIIDYLKGVK